MVQPELRKSKRRAAATTLLRDEAMSSGDATSTPRYTTAVTIDVKRRRIMKPSTKASKTMLAKTRKPSHKIATNTGDNVNDDDASTNSVLSYYWPYQPVAVSNELEYYEHLHISLSSSRHRKEFTTRRGDTVYLLAENGRQLFCRVDRFVSRKTGNGKDDKNSDCNIYIEGKWLFHHNDLVKLLGNSITPDNQEFIDRLQRQELVLSKTHATIDISGIQGNVRILYVQRNEQTPTALSTNTFLCRFTLDIDNANKTLEWGTINLSQLYIPVESEFDEGVEEIFEPTPSMSLSDNEHDDESVSTSSIEDSSKVIIQEGGGAALRSEIRVGSKFQIEITPFVASEQLVSRNPVLVYKANSISDDDLLQFLNDVAEIHSPYLHRNGILMTDPYTPLPHTRAEKVMQEDPDNEYLTGSSMSTASMLAGKRSYLSKECNADVILEILTAHNYDTKAALVTIERNLHRITSGWTRHEKDIFDDGFRRNNGSLRMIASNCAPTKSIKDVIDYFYRFKVPDQFRKFQNKKRILAIRMVECIETRKYHEASGLSNGGNSTNNCEDIDIPTHWTEKSVASIAVTYDDRIRSAKDLLLDVKSRYGRKVLSDVVSVIRQLNERYEPEARNILFKLLDGVPELQQRFLEYLPKHF